MYSFQIGIPFFIDIVNVQTDVQIVCVRQNELINMATNPSLFYTARTSGTRKY